MKFYCDTLGLMLGPRPQLSVGGAWLYCEEAMRERLIRHGAGFREAEIQSLGPRQFFVEDPEGVIIELNFAT